MTHEDERLLSAVRARLREIAGGVKPSRIEAASTGPPRGDGDAVWRALAPVVRRRFPRSVGALLQAWAERREIDPAALAERLGCDRARAVNLLASTQELTESELVRTSRTLAATAGISPGKLEPILRDAWILSQFAVRPAAKRVLRAARRRKGPKR